MNSFRIGQGFDVHQLIEGRKLTLCGVNVPHHKGLLGHSDADVAVHALCDALLGAAALGDIGRHFPDNDNQFKDIDSRRLLRQVVELLHSNGYTIGNVDLTIVAQAPKIMPFVEEMRANMALDLHLTILDVSIKGTTTEHLGFTGRGEGIAAFAVALIYRNNGL